MLLFFVLDGAKASCVFILFSFFLAAFLGRTWDGRVLVTTWEQHTLASYCICMVFNRDLDFASAWASDWNWTWIRDMIMCPGKKSNGMPLRLRFASIRCVCILLHVRTHARMLAGVVALVWLNE